MKYLSLIFIAAFISCSTDNHFSEYQQTSDTYTWHKSDVKKFHFTAEKSEIFSIELHIKYLTGLMWDTLYLNWKISDISNPQKNFESIKTPVTDENGMHIGTPQFDTWHTQILLTDSISLNKGEYEISLKHDMVEEILPFVSEVGIVIDKL
jgi:gliding motility-associated lipoprotein GldH